MENARNVSLAWQISSQYISTRINRHNFQNRPIDVVNELLDLTIRIEECYEDDIAHLAAILDLDTNPDVLHDTYHAIVSDILGISKIHWGRLIMTLYFASIIAEKAQNIGNEALIANVIKWTANLLTLHLKLLLSNRDKWTTVLTVEDSSIENDTIWNPLHCLSIALAGLGTLIAFITFLICK